MPKLSVIVPVYNTGGILKQSINSILEQSYRDYELILVNDGSIDNSGMLCDEIAKSDSRVHVIHKENGGAGSARNAGIRQASGDFVIFPDADDFCKPEMFENMLRLMEEDDCDLVICSYENVKVNEQGRRFTQNSQPLFDAVFDDIDSVRKAWFKIRSINISLLNTPWNKIYKKNIINQFNIRFPDLRRAQDAVFNLLYYDHIKSLKVTGQCLYQYNVNDVVRVGKKFPKDVYKCFVEYNRIMEKIISGWGMYQGEYKALCDNNFLGNIDSCVELCENPVWKLTKDEKISYLEKLIRDKYIEERLKNYSGNVTEIEDIIKPILDRRADKIVTVLKKRTFKEALRKTDTVQILRKIRNFLRK